MERRLRAGGLHPGRCWDRHAPAEPPTERVRSREPRCRAPGRDRGGGTAADPRGEWPDRLGVSGVPAGVRARGTGGAR